MPLKLLSWSFVWVFCLFSVVGHAGSDDGNPVPPDSQMSQDRINGNSNGKLDTNTPPNSNLKSSNCASRVRNQRAPLKLATWSDRLVQVLSAHQPSDFDLILNSLVELSAQPELMTYDQFKDVQLLLITWTEETEAENRGTLHHAYIAALQSMIIQHYGELSYLDRLAIWTEEVIPFLLLDLVYYEDFGFSDYEASDSARLLRDLKLDFKDELQVFAEHDPDFRYVLKAMYISLLELREQQKSEPGGSKTIYARMHWSWSHIKAVLNQPEFFREIEMDFLENPNYQSWQDALDDDDE